MKIVVGLGNPGDKYEGTRHNIGFAVVDEVARRKGLSFINKYSSEFAQSGGVYYLKPQTYMNLSGRAVSELANFFKIDVEDIFVIHDDMDIEFSKLKLKKGGSAGGHNGISSIIDCLGDKNFVRLKVGISRVVGQDVTNYVLGRFAPQEKEKLDDFIIRAADIAESVLDKGLLETQQNSKL